ncbi:MAG: NAD(P)-dependent oxidoreductase [Betaproteobacteria bacterium]|nr:NAD(P)-dependent oxidoreductase [Betaproteobacteria bacterium]MDH5222858.1 NAD(P)-dependent oxidoreductase [Betaproteobacteria bacterium]MDH5352544.1 NAD(P)-dependent oxidoreductase [Betaproteobacteria bacterium]
MNIGFVGLGVMGAHMAENLARAGHAVKGSDLRKIDVPGVAWAGTPAQAAAGADVVFTSLPGPKEVEALAATLGAAMARGTAWFDLTTNSPACVRRMHASLAERGIAFLDAPVSGGKAGARSGRLAIWVGGEQAVYRRFEPVLRAIGDQPFYVGPVGAGSIAKLAHNAASFTVQTALAEIFTLGVKAGVEPLALFQALRHGATGRKRTFDRLAEQYLPGAYDPPTFAVRLAHKDLSLALELAREVGVPMQVAERAYADFEEAMRRGWSERDSRTPMLLQNERAGVSPHVPAEKLREVLG